MSGFNGDGLIQSDTIVKSFSNSESPEREGRVTWWTVPTLSEQQFVLYRVPTVLNTVFDQSEYRLHVTATFFKFKYNFIFLLVTLLCIWPGLI